MGSYSAFALKQALDWRVEHVSRWGGGGGGLALPYLAYTGQVCAAEQNILSIKRGVEFYYCSRKIVIIFFIILIVKYSILIVNSFKSVVDSVFLGWKP